MTLPFKAGHGRSCCSFSFFSLLFVLFLAGSLHADGFRVYGLSAEAQSRGEAVVASVEDASAIWYNPGALTKVGKENLSLNSNQMILKSHFTSSSGQKISGQENYFTPFGLYYGSNLGSQNWAVGLGVNTPFGLGTEYNKTAPFRYITTGGDLSLIDINPTVAYKLFPTLSLGVGFDYYYSQAVLRQQYPTTLVISGAPDGSVTLSASGMGYGFNAGLLYQPNKHHSVGLTYRSQVVVKYKNGTAEIENLPGALGTTYKTGVNTAIHYPDMINFGYAYRPTERWLWEIGGQWTNWEDLRSIDTNFDQQTLLPNTVNKFDWKNSFVVRLGFEHQCTDHLAFSGGYFYSSSPTNEATYSPLVPDGDEHVLSTGVKYTVNDRWSVRIPVVGIIQPTRNHNPVGKPLINGEYSLYGGQVGLGIMYMFGA